MLLAAGKSTRLGALGRSLPKPLVPVCGYPPVAFGLTACVRAGLHEVVVNLFHHGDLIRSVLGDGAAYGARVAYSTEVDLLGTGGGIAQARALLGDGPVLVMNAKVVADVDLAEVVAAHVASGADATLVLRDDPDARTWGAIAADATGRVVGILDHRSPRPAATGSPTVERMFTGIQIMGPAIRERLRPVFSDSVRDGYIPLLLDGADIRAFVLPGYFAEHSTPARYLAGNLALLRRPELLPHPPGPLVGVDASARVDPGARLVPPVRIAAGAVIEAGAVVGPDVVVGEGATVAAGARLERTVVWAGQHATGTITDAVVTPDGVVPAVE
jgi:mannose-1-phosphate guanylyltransferase